jgi:hypothetical protein
VLEKEAAFGSKLFLSGSRPAGEFLSFACPKERNQRKGHPDGALILRVAGWSRGRQKARPGAFVAARNPLRAPSGGSDSSRRCSGAPYGTIQ